MTELNLFETQRSRLFSIAYRMLGSASDAEDVLQDAWVRFNNAQTDDLRSPQAFATTIVTRLCLDRLKSARARREEYVGPWLPEPVLTTGQQTPEVLAERSESVTLAFLVLLETLSPEERAVFLLKEIFDYEHAEIAGMLGVAAANSRQLFHRAKSKVRLASPPKSAEHLTQSAVHHPAQSATNAAQRQQARRDVAVRFAQMFRAGDAPELAKLLAAGVTFVADGGGKVPAARKPLVGREQVLNLLVGLSRSAHATGIAAQAALEVSEVNSTPALLVRIGGELDGVFVLSIEEGAIVGIQVVRNPEKLAYIKRQLSVPAAS